MERRFPRRHWLLIECKTYRLPRRLEIVRRERMKRVVEVERIRRRLGGRGRKRADSLKLQRAREKKDDGVELFIVVGRT